MSWLWRLFAWILSACGILVSGDAPEIRVVSAVRIETTSEEFPNVYTITDQETMGTVMGYLRQLDPYVPAEIDPETFRAYSAEITIEYSDGGQTHYTQLYTDYLKTDNGPWKKIAPEDGANLWRILTCISETNHI